MAGMENEVKLGSTWVAAFVGSHRSAEGARIYGARSGCQNDHSGEIDFSSYLAADDFDSGGWPHLYAFRKGGNEKKARILPSEL